MTWTEVMKRRSLTAGEGASASLRIARGWWAISHILARMRRPTVAATQ